MDPSAVGLQSVLVLLAPSVIAVAVCQSLRLPPMVGYLLTGPPSDRTCSAWSRARGDSPARRIRRGVLMFSIGLEFSLSKLKSMRRLVFGLGLAQVGATVMLAVALRPPSARRGRSGLRSAGIAAMSSTAIVSKLAERGELDSRTAAGDRGAPFPGSRRRPLLVLIPVLGQTADAIGVAVVAALAKAAAALGLVIVGGPRPMRAWLRVCARRRSNELFVRTCC